LTILRHICGKAKLFTTLRVILAIDASCVPLSGGKTFDNVRECNTAEEIFPLPPLCFLKSKRSCVYNSVDSLKIASSFEIKGADQQTSKHHRTNAF